MGAAGPDPRVGPVRRPSEGLRRGGSVALASEGPPGAVLPDAAQRLLRQLVRGGVPRGDVAGVGRAVRRGLGWGHDASWGPDPATDVPLRRSAELGGSAPVGTDALSGRAAVGLAEVRSIGQLRPS